jgi:hypothetical protein
MPVRCCPRPTSFSCSRASVVHSNSESHPAGGMGGAEAALAAAKGPRTRVSFKSVVCQVAEQSLNNLLPNTR